MNKLAGLPSSILEQIHVELKKQPGRAGDSTYPEYWAEFDKRALSKRKEIDGKL